MSKPAPRGREIRKSQAGGLALVRLRLRLVLLTMAIVPVVISTAFVYAVIGSQGSDEREHASRASAALAMRLTAELEGADTLLRLLAGDPAVRGYLGATQGRAEFATSAREHIADLERLGLPGLVGVSILDRDLRLQLTADGQPAVESDGALPDEATVRSALRLEHSAVRRSPPYVAPDGDRRLSMVVPIRPTPGAPAAGVLRFEFSVDRLVLAAAPALLSHGDVYALIVDRATHEVMADSRVARPSPPPASPAGIEEMLGPLARQVGDSASRLLDEGWAVGVSDVELAIPGGAAWSVIVFDATQAPTFPIDLIGALGLLAVLVIGLSLWMSRRVLRPAEELEASRSQLKELYDVAREDALRDALTGLGNHRAFQEELDRQMEWYRRYHVPLALLLVDLDDLKLINDSAGHAAGDDHLRRMGRLISEVTRYADRAFRIGGDEFAVLMPHTDAAGALELGRRLQARAAQPGRAERPVAFSAGISACPALATSRNQLYAQADAALYWCKRHGRGTLDVFDPLRDREADQPVNDELTAAIVRVAGQRLLRPVFQPIVDMADGRVLGYEGLVRPTEESGFADPGSLFAAAEAVGRTVELDQACLDVVAAGAIAIPHELVVSINLSPRTVEAPHFSAASILGTLARHGIDPRRVILELTEREDVQDPTRLRRNMADLQAAGVRIAADDVGAGNAGLRLLSQFRFDIVKIDLSLVQEGAQRAASRAVLRSLRDLAGRWQAFVIAEGLETAEQLRVVRELGIGAAQGYLLGRPSATLGGALIDLGGLEQGHLLLQAAPAAPSSAPERGAA